MNAPDECESIIFSCSNYDTKVSRSAHTLLELYDVKTRVRERERALASKSEILHETDLFICAQAGKSLKEVAGDLHMPGLVSLVDEVRTCTAPGSCSVLELHNNVNEFDN